MAQDAPITRVQMVYGFHRWNYISRRTQHLLAKRSTDIRSELGAVMRMR
jgi:hypothetical protein